MAKIYPKQARERYLLIVAIAFILGTVATSCLADDVTVKMADTVKVGRQYVAEIKAEYEGKPADAILVDIDGELDFNLFENNSKLCYTPTATGTIKIKLVAIWFEARRATQSFVKVKVTDGTAPNPPPTKPTPGKDFSALEASVSALASKLPDPSGKAALSETYRGLSEAVTAGSVYSQTYFGRKYEYNFDKLDEANTHINNAVSKSLSVAKSKSQVTDSLDWADSFLIPVKKLSEDFDLNNRDELSGFLNAVSVGLTK